MKERARTLVELIDGLYFFFNDPSDYDEKGIKKYFSTISAELLQKLQTELFNGVVFDPENLELLIRQFAEKQNTNASQIIHPLRLALTGKTFSPGIFEVMQILGKERVLRRINKAVQYIKNKK